LRLLHIDASPRGERSHTRRLTREAIAAWLSERPADEVVHLEVGRRPPPPVDEHWIAAAFTSPDSRTPDMRAALAVSDALVRQLLSAELLIVGLPMYNFGVPAAFKAYIDQIVRVGVTFAFEPDAARPYTPLVRGKRMLVIVATGDGGYGPGGPFEHLNHVDRYVRTVFGFIGIEEIEFVHVGYDEFGGERLAASFVSARQRLERLVHRLSRQAAPHTQITSD
jgi:FMN-dependent NADH-azoreductase